MILMIKNVNKKLKKSNSMKFHIFKVTKMEKEKLTINLV
jgi:hypothetical protein